MSAAGLLIYDGDCGFCTSTARWYAARAGSGASIAPWHSLDLDELGLTETQVTTSVWFRDDRGELHEGADACAEAMKAADGAWRFAGAALAAPGVIHLARSIYPIIAKNRHRLPGATDACRIEFD